MRRSRDSVLECVGGHAYWLLDEIAIIQHYNKFVAAEQF
jgi:hypothetical protein